MVVANRLSGVRGKRPGAKTLTVTGFVVVVVIALAWWVGPGLFGATDTAATSRIVRATVTDPVSCTGTHGQERVKFTLDGEQRDGRLAACGHDEQEQLRVALPEQPGSGQLTVHSAAASTGYSAVLVPLGLLLLALGGVAGAVYAFLLAGESRTTWAG